MGIKANLIFIGISVAGLLICAIVIKVKGEEWKKEGNSKARTLTSLLFIAFLLSTIITQAAFWVS